MQTYFNVNPEEQEPEVHTNPLLSVFQHSSLICNIMAHLSSPILHYLHRHEGGAARGTEGG